MAPVLKTSSAFTSAFLPMRQRESEAKAQHHGKETKKRTREIKQTQRCARRAPSGAFSARNQQKEKRVKEDEEEEEETALLETLCRPDAPSTRCPD